MTDFIAAYDAEINAALDEQGKAFAATRDRFAERTEAAEIGLIAAMTHRGRLYVAGPDPDKPPDSTPAEVAPTIDDNHSAGAMAALIEAEGPPDDHSTD